MRNSSDDFATWISSEPLVPNQLGESKSAYNLLIDNDYF